MSYMTCAIQSKTTGRFLFILKEGSTVWEWPGTTGGYESKQCFDSVDTLLGYQASYNAFVIGKDRNSVLHCWVDEEMEPQSGEEHQWCHLGQFPDRIHDSVSLAMKDVMFVHHCLEVEE